MKVPLLPVEIKRKDRRVDGYRVQELSQILADYDIVEAQDTHLVVVDKGHLNVEPPGPMQLAAPTTSPSFAEMGSNGQSSYMQLSRIDYNPDLRGTVGMRKYDQMRRSDAQVRSTLRLLKTPILGARWFMAPASPSKQDQKIAQWVWDNFNKYMTASWPELLMEILAMLDFGYYTLEKVFTNEDVPGKITWRKLAPRHPMDILWWYFDANGGPEKMEMYGPGGTGATVFIPISKLLVFSYDKEAGNIFGISALRSGYKHWYYKENLYKVDAIQKERHGVGIPVIKLPPQYSEQDKRVADEMGRNLRTNEKAHIILPPLWDVIFADLQGHPVDIMASIEHHDKMLAHNILAPFLNSAGSRTVSDQIDLFTKGTRFIADIIRTVFNKYAIPELVDFNWKTVDSYPELKVRRIGDTVDWQKMSFAIRNFVGANILEVDDKIEEWVRDEMDLPPKDPATVRQVPTPQAPGGGVPGQQPPGLPNVGPPRQGPPPTPKLPAATKGQPAPRQ